jgi:hypothetical protein
VAQNIGRHDSHYFSSDAARLPLKLINTPDKRYVVIGEGTHTVALEKNRMQLITQVQSFLDE